MYITWVNTILGAVIIAVAFMDLSASRLMWTLGIAGAVIAFSNLWTLLVGQEEKGVGLGHRV